MQQIWKRNAWEEGWVKKELALLKSLIYGREEQEALEARLNKIDQSRSNLSADIRKNEDFKRNIWLIGLGWS